MRSKRSSLSPFSVPSKRMSRRIGRSSTSSRILIPPVDALPAHLDVVKEVGVEHGAEVLLCRGPIKGITFNETQEKLNGLVFEKCVSVDSDLADDFALWSLYLLPLPKPQFRNRREQAPIHTRRARCFVSYGWFLMHSRVGTWRKWGLPLAGRRPR